jgi:hypothetical protein
VETVPTYLRLTYAVPPTHGSCHCSVRMLTTLPSGAAALTILPLLLASDLRQPPILRAELPSVHALLSLASFEVSTPQGVTQ